MKKFIVPVIIALIAPLLMLTACGKAEELKLSEYSLNLTFDDVTMTLDGEENISYVNTSDNSFTQLYFHLYPNAFREDAEYKPYNLATNTSCFPNGVSYGDITISSVTSGKQVLDFEVGGEDCNLLIVKLPRELFPGEYVSLDINFCVRLANINHRLGYGNNAINFGNFYPIACVYEEGKGFATSPYCANGDPFYSDVSNYKVKITYPDRYKCVSSGLEIDTLASSGKKVTHVQGSKIRDFCFVLSDRFKEKSAKVGNTAVNYYSYYDTDPTQSLKIAAQAVETFNALFGDYPYSVLNVVETNFNTGGMEYPNLVMISDRTGSSADYAYVIVHEIAHQWWYGVVGNDEYNHAWQDEGLTEYSTLLFFREHDEYGEDFEALVKNATSVYKRFVEVYSGLIKDFSTAMDRPISAFETEPEYVHLTYTKGVLMFDTLRESVGDRKFTRALKDYYKKFAYRNASSADMIASFSVSTGYNLESFFNSWLNGEVIIK